MGVSTDADHEPRTGWTFLTNHARILLMISRDPEVRLRDLADACGLTERAVRAIVADLEHAGYLTRERVGRRNRYRIVPGTPFRHPAEEHFDIGILLRTLAREGPGHRPPSGRGESAGGTPPPREGERAGRRPTAVTPPGAVPAREATGRDRGREGEPP